MITRVNIFKDLPKTGFASVFAPKFPRSPKKKGLPHPLRQKTQLLDNEKQLFCLEFPLFCPDGFSLNIYVSER